MTTLELMQRCVTQDTIEEKCVLEYPSDLAELVTDLPAVIQALQLAALVNATLDNVLLHHGSRMSSEDLATRRRSFLALEAQLKHLGVF